MVQAGPGVVGAQDLGTFGDVWVLDARIRYGTLIEQLLNWRDTVFANEEFVSYFRQRAGFFQAKRIARDDSLFLFRQSRKVTDGPVLLDLKRGQNYLHAARAELAAAIGIGQSLRLLRGLEHFAEAPLQRVMVRLRRPMSQHQWRVWTDAKGEPCAVVTWARMTRQDAQAAKPWSMLETPRWSEGRLWVVVDAVATVEGIDPLCAALGEELFGDEDLCWCPPADRWYMDEEPRSLGLVTVPSSERPRWARKLARCARAEVAGAEPGCVVDLTSLAGRLNQEGEPRD